VTPFLQFRLWLRRGPNGERAVAAIAAALVLALLVWALVPVDDTADVEAAGTIAEATTTTVDAEAPVGEAPETGPTEATPSGTAGVAGRPSGTTTTSGAPADPCAGLSASDQGVTKEQIFVAVPIIDLGGDVGNETFGIRSDLEEVANAAAAGINASGGVACRKLRIKTYPVSPLDQNR
jgi:hypothetical protein